MLKKSSLFVIGFFMLIGLALPGCGGVMPAPSATPIPTPPKTLTPTPIPTPTPRPIELTVLHTNDTWGYSEPCG